MLHRAWNSKGEMPYCFPRSSIKFQGHMALKIVQFDPNWAFPDCNFSLNSPMAMKCCTELETTKERCPIVFQGHPSNFKVTRDKTSLILSQIGHFRTIGRSQLSNPSDLPCFFQVNPCLQTGGLFVHVSVYYIIGWYLSGAESEGWGFESPSGRDIFCLKNFDTFTRTSVRVSKMNAVGRTQLTYQMLSLLKKYVTSLADI